MFILEYYDKFKSPIVLCIKTQGMLHFSSFVYNNVFVSYVTVVVKRSTMYVFI